MFEPVFHYLIEAVRICSQVTDVPAAGLTVVLLGIVGLLAGVLVLRSRTSR